MARHKKYHDYVSSTGNEAEVSRANPDMLGTPDPVEKLADNGLLYQSVRNLSDPYKELVINHLGLFGRDPKSIRQMAEQMGLAKSTVFDMYKVAQGKLRKEFFRLLNGGKVDEVVD